MMFRGKYRHVHFVGIGGIGMSGIAEVLVTLGFNVSGSDIKESATVNRLRAARRWQKRAERSAHRARLARLAIR